MSDSAATSRRRLVTSSAGGWLIVCGLVLLLWPGATIRVLVVLVALGALGFGISELSRVVAGGGRAPDLWACCGRVRSCWARRSGVPPGCVRPWRW
jgi:uncharacterized membrane protein HdeD (DUF308 family)